MHAGPIGERRSSEHDRADAFWVDRAHHHDLPAGLAVADQTRLALGVRVTLDDLLDKAGLRLAHILDRLTGHRVRQKADEIAGMAGGERDADLAVVLHAADAWAVAGSGVEDDERSLVRVDRGALQRDDPHQPVIHRPRKRAAIEDQLGIKAQHIRRRTGIVLATVVAALPEHVEQQNGALPSVDPVVEQVVRAGHWPMRRRVRDFLRHSRSRITFHVSLSAQEP
jgi:hypothetical protein